MPYCPHCDMEFIEGVERCTDCGQKLVASKAAWKAGAAEREAKEEAKRAKGDSQYNQQCGYHRPLQLQTELKRDGSRVASTDTKSRARFLGCQ